MDLRANNELELTKQAKDLEVKEIMKNAFFPISRYFPKFLLRRGDEIWLICPIFFGMTDFCFNDEVHLADQLCFLMI